MTDNPYDAPRADLSPPDLPERRTRLKAWLWDRLMLWVFGAAFCFVFSCGFTLLMLALEWLGVIRR